MVTALPGASAVLAALTVAGLPTDQFFFAGFLPPKAAARRARIAELAPLPATLILFESGPRIAASFADLAAGLGADREAAVCRELTKLHEEIKRGDLARLATACAGDELRGEIVVVIAPAPAPPQIGAAESESLLRDALRRLSLKDAVAEVAELTGLRRRDIYQSALALQKAAKNEAKHGASR
jgi:16S rRNA (cytidine1402-2'-O)-methyltransferase